MSGRFSIDGALSGGVPFIATMFVLLMLNCPARTGYGSARKRRIRREKNMKRTARKKLAAAATMALGFFPLNVSADAVTNFYKGKQLSIQVGFGAGGGFDTTARIFAQHFGKHIPGNPSVIVQNVPGGGSMKLANKLYNASPKDGLHLGMMSSSIYLVPLYGKRKAKFDTARFEFIGNIHTDIMSCGVWKGAGQGIKSLHDLIKAKRPVIFGSSSPASPMSQYPTFLKNVFGAKVKVIHGYRGTKATTLAMKRGEIHGSCGLFESSVRGPFRSDVKSGNLNLFMQIGLDKKVEFFGEHATQVYKELKSDEHRAMARLLFEPFSVTRPLAAPPGTPKDRVAALRIAFDETMKDPALIESAKKRIGVQFQPMTGAKVEALFAGYFKTSRDLVDKTWKIANTPKNPRKKKK